MISIIGIEGADCAMNFLGKSAEFSNGEVNIVNPLELQRKVRKLVDTPVIATDVHVTTILHPAMVFRLKFQVENLIL